MRRRSALELSRVRREGCSGSAARRGSWSSGPAASGAAPAAPECAKPRASRCPRTADFPCSCASRNAMSAAASRTGPSSQPLSSPTTCTPFSARTAL